MTPVQWRREPSDCLLNRTVSDRALPTGRESNTQEVLPFFSVVLTQCGQSSARDPHCAPRAPRAPHEGRSARVPMCVRRLPLCRGNTNVWHAQGEVTQKTNTQTRVRHMGSSTTQRTVINVFPPLTTTLTFHRILPFVTTSDHSDHVLPLLPTDYHRGPYHVFKRLTTSRHFLPVLTAHFPCAASCHF